VAIFTRRIIQRELDSLRPSVIDAIQLKDIISRLNGRERQAISAEWEIVLAAAFARTASVRYEPTFGTKRPDLFVATVEGSTEFIADIVAISDDDSDKKNPASYFFEEFHRFAEKHGLVNGGFDIRIGDRTTGKWPDRVNTLLLPAKKDIPSFIKQELSDLMRSIALKPTAPHKHQRGDGAIDLQIAYDPARLGGSTGGYSGYNSAYSLTRNPLFAALNSKARKLRCCGYNGMKGIIVVDGGAHLLRARQRSGTTWSCGDIIEYFLRRHEYIDFVTTTHHEHEPHIFGNRRQRFSHTVFWQRPFNQEKIDMLSPLLKSAFKSLPTPVDSPQNAMATVRSRHNIDRGCNFGWYTWTPNHRLAYSVRTLLPLIGGFMSNREFKQLLEERTPFRNPLFDFFAGLFKTGSKIVDVRIEQRPDDDDDAIVFDLAERKEPTQCGHFVEEPICEMPTSVLVKYFVQLAFEASLPDQNRFSIGMLPIPIQQNVRDHLRAGRLPTSASLSQDGDTIRLGFGAPDAAISAFR
jgi:hypothetical protein